eukprot:s2710_g10.t1
MDHPVPGSSHESEAALDGESRAESGQGRPVRWSGTAEIGSLRVERPRQSDEQADDEDDEAFDSEEFREWMRNRGRTRRNARPRRRDSSDGSDGGGRDDGRTNAGPPPEWDGESVGFQDYLIKARLWLATTRSKPRTRGPLLLSKLTKVPFETMKFLAKDAKWMQSPDNGEELVTMMDQSEYFGDDRDEDLLSALAKITYHVRREKSEAHRAFFNRWETAYRKVVEHRVQLPDKYTGFLLIQALCLSEQEIKAMLNYTRGSILPKDIKDYVRKHETKLQVSQVGVEKKPTTNTTGTKASGHYLLNDEETDVDDEEIHALESALRDLHDGESPGDPSGPQEGEGPILEEYEAAEVLSTMLSKRRSFAQSQKAKKAKELGRGYHQPPKGRGKSFSTTTSGRQPFRSGQYRMTIEEVKKVTKCGHCHKVGHWHRECPELHRGGTEKGQHLLESEEATFCGLLEVGDPAQSPENPSLTPDEDELTGNQHSLGSSQAVTMSPEIMHVGTEGPDPNFGFVQPMSPIPMYLESNPGPRNTRVIHLSLQLARTMMMESDRKRSRPGDRNQGVFAAWARILLKVLFAMGRVNELAQRLLRPRSSMASQGEFPSESKRASSAVDDDFEVITMRRGTATSVRSSAIAPSQASSINGTDLLTEQIYRMVGPPLQCDHHEATKLYVCRKQGENYKRLFWPCPRSRGQQCQTFVWCQVQPYLDQAYQPEAEEMDRATMASSPTAKSQMSAESLLLEAQRRCQHKKTSKSGTNPYKIQEKCTICGKILHEEKTELGLKIEAEKKKKAMEPTYQEYLEWKRSGALESAGVWTDKGPTSSKGSRRG